MRVAVVGSRSIVDQDLINYHLDKLLIPCGGENGDEVTIISGGAKGVDTLAREWARINNKDFVLFKPFHLIDTEVTYHPRYYFIRNKQIVDNCDMLIVFWDGESNGTKDALKQARKQAKEIVLIKLDDESKATDNLST